MPLPFELLLRVQESREIDRGLFIDEQLRRGDSKRINSGKGRRDAIGRIGSDRTSEVGHTIWFDLKLHRRIRFPGDLRHAKKTRACRL